MTLPVIFRVKQMLCCRNDRIKRGRSLLESQLWNLQTDSCRASHLSFLKQSSYVKGEILMCRYWIIIKCYVFIDQLLFKYASLCQECKLWEKEKHEKSVVMPKYFSVYVMILLIPLLIEYSGLSNLSLWKLASLSHTCSIWLLHSFSLNVNVKSGFPVRVSHRLLLWSFLRLSRHTWRESFHSLPELPPANNGQEERLPFVPAWCEGQQCCLAGKFLGSTSSSRRWALWRVRSVQTHLWIAL